MDRRAKRASFLLLDLLLIPTAMFVSMVVQNGFNLIETSQNWPLIGSLCLLMCVFGAWVSSLLGLPQIRLNTYEQSAILATVVFAALVAVMGAITHAIISGGQAAPFSFLVFGMALTIMCVAGRLILRRTLTEVYIHGKNRQRVLIYGAGQTGIQFAFALKNNDTLEPVAFVDDNTALHGLTVAGLRVYSPIQLQRLVEEKQVDRIVLAMPSQSRPKQMRLLKRIRHLGCDVRMMPSFASLIGEGDLLSRVEPVNFGALLNRPGRVFDRDRIDSVYQGETILITGAGGSIGSELCRQIFASHPKRLVLYDVSEAALYQIDRELRDMLAVRIPGEPHIDVVPILGSVTDRVGVTRLMEKYRPDTVFHAAAYKHVPMVEQNQLPALRNNVFGTRIVAEAALAAEVARFVLVSTDKAVRPSNVMGASKRLAELVVQDLQTRSTSTRFSIVRFGNVLGSSGSVIPLFEEQIARGGPVTVTHRDVTRYFMTVREASHLVLLAATYADGGEVFVLDMGRPVAICDLARQMIESRGYTVCDEENPSGDIEIVYTGLRPGEKLHEELLIGSDVVATENDKILRAREEFLSQVECGAMLRDLETAIEEGDWLAAKTVLHRWVRGYSTEPLRVTDDIEGFDAPGTLT